MLVPQQPLFHGQQQFRAACVERGVGAVLSQQGNGVGHGFGLVHSEGTYQLALPFVMSEG